MKKTLLAAGLLAATAFAAPPPLKLIGTFTSKASSCAMLLGEHPYVVHAGERFGPFSVAALEPGLLTLKEGETSVPYKMAEATVASAPTRPAADTFRLELVGAELPAALKLLSHGTGVDMVAAPDLAPHTLDLRGDYNPTAALTAMLTPEQTGYVAANGVLVVAPTERLKEIKSTYATNLINLKGQAQTRCTLDFTSAALGPFLEVVAHREGALNLGPDVDKTAGSVSCRLRKRPAADVLALALAVQNPSLFISQSQGVWTVH